MIYQELVDLIREHNLQVKKVALCRDGGGNSYEIYTDKGDYIVELTDGNTASLGANKEEITGDVVNVIREYFEVRNIDNYGKLIKFLDKNSENNKAWVGE